MMLALLFVYPPLCHKSSDQVSGCISGIGVRINPDQISGTGVRIESKIAGELSYWTMISCGHNNEVQVFPASCLLLSPGGYSGQKYLGQQTTTAAGQKTHLLFSYRPGNVVARVGETACRVLRVFGRTPVKVYLTSHTRMTSSINLGNFLHQRRRHKHYNINLRSTLQSNNVLKSDFSW